jgi:outer membrane autotransporter protein
LAPRSDFSPAGVSLSKSQSSLAAYHSRAWNNSDTAFATRFAELSRISDAGDYKTALDAYSSKATHAQSIALANSAGTILGAAMSCPVFVDQNVLLGEDNCVWARVTGSWTDQWASGDTQGYHVSGTTYRIGAQHEILPDWYLGASFAAGKTWATMDQVSSGDGDTYDGSVTLKHTMGPWQFAGSVAFAGGEFHTDRQIRLPGVSETVKSDPSMFLAGGRLRAGYEFAFDDWYIRPYGDLDVVYTDLPGFEEKGSDLYALDVRGSSKTSVALSPMVEFGGRLDVDEATTLRAYAAFGVSYLPDNTRTIHSSFVGASSADGTFSDFIDSPEVMGRIDLGLQLFRAGGFEVKGQYTADVGESFLSQTASARFAYHF